MLQYATRKGLTRTDREELVTWWQSIVNQDGDSHTVTICWMAGHWRLLIDGTAEGDIIECTDCGFHIWVGGNIFEGAEGCPMCGAEGCRL